MAYTLLYEDRGPYHLDLVMTFTTVNDESPWIHIPKYTHHTYNSIRSGATNYAINLRGVHALSLTGTSGAVVTVATATEASPSGTNAQSSFIPWPYMQFRLSLQPSAQTVTFFISYRR